MHYGDFTRRYARRTPQKIALVDRDRQFSYAELQSATERLARALSLLGIGRQERIVFLGDNGHLPFEIMIAASKLGLVYVPIDFRLTVKEAASIIQDCEPAIVIGGASQREQVASLKQQAHSVAHWIIAGDESLEGFSRYEQMIDEADEQNVDEASDDGLFCIIYTSGTTGKAKGVTTSHLSTIQNGMAVASTYNIDAETRFLMSLPYSATGVVNHSSGPTLMMGGTVVFDEVRNFDARRFFSVVERNSVTHCQLVPTMMFRLLESPDRASFDLSSLRTVGYGSAPIPPHRVEQLIRAFGPIFVQAYGMTETCSIATALGHEEHEVVGLPRQHILASCGRAVPGVSIRIIDDAGQIAAPGEVGEITIRAPWNTTGYWNNRRRTCELLRDGWLHTGDLGRLNSEEYLYVVDRMKDTVITGGSKVFSPEVEAAIASHPAVADVAVVGLPDEQWGERVHAVIVCHAAAEVPSPEEIIIHAALKLSRYKLPKSVDFVAEIPRTSTGKYAKNVLRARATSGPPKD